MLRTELRLRLGSNSNFGGTLASTCVLCQFDVLSLDFRWVWREVLSGGFGFEREYKTQFTRLSKLRSELIYYVHGVGFIYEGYLGIDGQS